MGSSPTPGTILDEVERIKKNMDSTQVPSKVLKFFFAGSIVAYFGMNFVIEKVILMETEEGFVYKPDDEVAMLLLYVFAGVSLLNAGLQFVVPSWIRSKLNSPSGDYNADLVRYALCETIGVLGFLLFVLSGQKVESWIFMGVAMLLLLFGDRKGQKVL